MTCKTEEVESVVPSKFPRKSPNDPSSVDTRTGLSVRGQRYQWSVRFGKNTQSRTGSKKGSSNLPGLKFWRIRSSLSSFLSKEGMVLLSRDWGLTCTSKEPFSGRWSTVSGWWDREQRNGWLSLLPAPVLSPCSWGTLTRLEKNLPQPERFHKLVPKFV